MAQADNAVGALLSASKVAVQRLASHLRGFDIFLVEHTSVATDVISQSGRLVERTTALVESAEIPVPFGERLIAHLQTLIEQATAAHEAHQDAMADLQERRHALRETALRFEAELIALRRALRQVIGSNHRDYHALRVPRTPAEVQALTGDSEPTDEPTEADETGDEPGETA